MTQLPTNRESETMTKNKALPTDRCHTVLQRLLSAGPQPAGSVRVALEAVGFAWRSTQDAAVRLSVRRTKTSMHGGWMWALPSSLAEDAGTKRAFGEANVPRTNGQAVTCLAAYGYLVPDDGMMHGTPNRD